METITYRNQPIHIEHDFDPINPLTFGDCYPLTFVTRDREIIHYDVGREYDHDDSLSELRNLINWACSVLSEQQLLTFLDPTALNSWTNLLHSVRCLYRDYRDECPDLPNVKEILEEVAIEDALIRQTESCEETLMEVQRLLKLTGVPTVLQEEDTPDYCVVLSVVTESFAVRLSNPGDPINPTDQRWHNSARIAVQEYVSWANGEVYGATVFKDSAAEESCYGFCGYYHEQSGLMDWARAEIDAVLARKPLSEISVGDYRLASFGTLYRLTWSDGHMRYFGNVLDALSVIQEEDGEAIKTDLPYLDYFLGQTFHPAT